MVNWISLDFLLGLQQLGSSAEETLLGLELIKTWILERELLVMDEQQMTEQSIPEILETMDELLSLELQEKQEDKKLDSGEYISEQEFLLGKINIFLMQTNFL